MEFAVCYLNLFYVLTYLTFRYLQELNWGIKFFLC